MDLSFISLLGEEVIGPVQRDEAILLFALTRVTRPRVVVELGYGWGASSTAFLAGLDDGAILYSVDIEAKVQGCHESDTRFRFINKDLRDLTPADVRHEPIDLLFFDAAHDDLAAKIQAHDSLAGILAPQALILVHDTGLWHKSFMGPATDVIADGVWVTPELYAHQPGERDFANWLARERQYRRIDLSSSRCLRHGLSILQM